MAKGYCLDRNQKLWREQLTLLGRIWTIKLGQTDKALRGNIYQVKDGGRAILGKESLREGTKERLEVTRKTSEGQK